MASPRHHRLAQRAVELLRGSGVRVGCVIGFPHGNSGTESKRYETELACRDGEVEIDMVINIGKALSGDWAYVERDIRAVGDEAHRNGAKVKVIFENDYLANGGAGLSSDDFKRQLCQIAERAGADWVKTSTGYGFAKQKDATITEGRWMPSEAASRVSRRSRSKAVPDGLIRVQSGNSLPRPPRRDPG
jgi:deoxyribose-phosphate aldolase